MNEYRKGMQRDCDLLEEDVLPLDCSVCASEITDDIETDDNVVHRMHADLLCLVNFCRKMLTG